MNINDIYRLKIERLDDQGRGIGKVNDKTIFVSNILIDEIVDVKITNIKKKFMEGEVVKYIEISNKRIKPICKYFEDCGGCDLMHMSYDDQLKYKQDKVKRIINKFSNIDSNLVTDIIGSKNNLNYRNKITLHINNGIGLYQRKSNEIIKIDECLITDKRINDIIKLINDNISINNIKEIIIKASKNTNDLMLIFDANSIDKEKIIDVCKNKVTSIMLKKDNNYYLVYGKDYIIEKIGNFKFMISADSFFQVNTNQAEILYNKVLEYADLSKDDYLLDLYCGTGTISLYLSNYVHKVFGIEINKYAIKNAFKNKEINNIDNAEFICSDVSKLVNNIDFKPTVIVVDPPRSGLDKVTINYILNGNVKKVVYVSCDPITLARDLSLLNEKYEVKKITPVDMFPNTHHVECVVLLSLKQTSKSIKK